MESGTGVLGPDLRYLVWTARGAALLVVVLCLLFAVGYAVPPPGFDHLVMQPAEVLLFPVGMCLGYLIALRWPLTGGVLSLACLAVFVGARRELIYVIFLGPLSLPGIFFYFYGMHLLDQRRAS